MFHDVGDLPPGTPVTITFDADVAPDTPVGALDVTATGTTATNQSDTTDDADTVTLAVETDVDLTVTKVADRPSVSVGDEVTFTITVSNTGASTALDATVVDDLPAELRATSATSAAGPCAITDGGALVTCEPIDVAAGGSVSVTIIAEAIAGGAVTNVATVDCVCLVAGVVSPPAEVEVDQLADLSIAKTVSDREIRRGATTTFTITVSNAGPDAATDVVVSERLPSGLDLVSSAATQGTFSQAAGTWVVGDLANGADATLTLTVVATAEGNIVNSVSVSSPVEDPNPANDAASTDLMVRTPDLPRTGSDGPGPMVQMSVLAIALGALLLVLGRRRRRPTGGPLPG